MSGIDVVTVACISAGVAIVALAISIITMWRAHFSLLNPIAVVGRLCQRVYPIKNDVDEWYMMSVDIPISLCNPGAQPLLIQGVRIRLHFPEIPIPKNYELIHAKWEIKSEQARKIDKNRFQWLQDICPIDWMPFTVLSKATVTKHLIFETRWEDPVIQTKTHVSIEVLSSSEKSWVVVGEWELNMGAKMWVEMASFGRGIVCVLKESKVEYGEKFPKDLHKYTGTKDPIPTTGGMSSSSSLNYPKP